LRNFAFANNREYILAHSSGKKPFYFASRIFRPIYFVPKTKFFFLYISATKAFLSHLLFFDFQEEKLQENEGDSLIKNK
jgi:hypothetical protein